MRLVALFLTLLASPALAECPARMLPPAYFDHEPTKMYTVFMEPGEMMSWTCGTLASGLPMYGCAQEVEDGIFFIHVLSTMEEERIQCVLRHEKGHVNGWSHNPGVFEYRHPK